MTDESFDMPFSAGMNALIHPGSMVLDLRISVSDFQKYYQWYQEQSKSYNDLLITNRLKSFEMMPIEFRNCISRQIHEIDHQVRFLGTSFGFLCDEVRNRWLIRAAELVQERATNGQRPLFPASLAKVPLRITFDEALDWIATYSRDHSVAEALFVGTDHLLTALLDDIATSRFASAMWGLTNGQQKRIKTLIDSVETKNFKCAAFPTFDSQGQYSGLTARHLLELFAVRSQWISLAAADASYETINHLFQDVCHEYALAHNTWHTYFRNAPEMNSDGSLDETQFHNLDELYPFELIVAADLALWPPFFPDSELDFKSVTWSDLNPGRRFVKVFHAIRHLKISISTKRPENLNDSFLDLQARICSNLGWETPHDIAQAWLTHFRQLGGRTYWSILDGTSKYRVKNIMSQLDARLKRPAELVLDLVGNESPSSRRASAWIIQKNASSSFILPADGNGFEVLTPYLLLESVQQLICGDRPIFGSGYTPRLRRAAIKMTLITLAKAGQWNSTTMEQFYRENVHLFNL